MQNLDVYTNGLIPIISIEFMCPACEEHIIRIDKRLTMQNRPFHVLLRGKEIGRVLGQTPEDALTRARACWATSDRFTARDRQRFTVQEVQEAPPKASRKKGPHVTRSRDKRPQG